MKHVNLHRRLCGAAVSAVLLLAAGCTAESTRQAIEAQRRVDLVQQTIFERQHDGLSLLLYRDLLYRDLLARLAAAGAELTPAQREVLSAVWNERDLVEFWAIQQERTRALRLIAVDTKLFSDQSIVDLLWKSIETRLERAQQGFAAYAAEQAGHAAEQAAQATE